VGYRSAVAYTIRFKEVGKMVMFMTEAKSKGLEGALEECEIDQRKLQINFYAEGVKWYDSYPDVIVHQNLMQMAKDWCDGDTHEEIKRGGAGHEAYSLGYIRVIIGEEINDITEESYVFADWDWLKPSRTIVADWL